MMNLLVKWSNISFHFISCHLGLHLLIVVLAVLCTILHCTFSLHTRHLSLEDIEVIKNNQYITQQKSLWNSLHMVSANWRYIIVPQATGKRIKHSFLLDRIGQRGVMHPRRSCTVATFAHTWGVGLRALGSEFTSSSTNTHSVCTGRVQTQ